MITYWNTRIYRKIQSVCLLIATLIGKTCLREIVARTFLFRGTKCHLAIRLLRETPQAALKRFLAI